MASEKKMTHDLYARIPESLWQQVKALAKRHKRSVTAEVEWVLQQYVQEHQGELPAENATRKGGKAK
jgi:hypothetical protein